MCERCNSNKPTRLYLVRKGDRDFARRLCDDCLAVTKAVYDVKIVSEKTELAEAQEAGAGEGQEAQAAEVQEATPEQAPAAEEEEEFTPRRRGPKRRS